MTTCDWCETLLPLSALFNVDYLNEDGSENGYANVLCADCVEESREMHDNNLEVWQSASL